MLLSFLIPRTLWVAAKHSVHGDLAFYCLLLGCLFALFGRLAASTAVVSSHACMTISHGELLEGRHWAHYRLGTGRWRVGMGEKRRRRWVTFYCQWISVIYFSHAHPRQVTGSPLPRVHLQTGTLLGSCLDSLWPVSMQSLGKSSLWNPGSL